VSEAAAPPALRCGSVSVQLGGHTIVSDASFALPAGALVALVGPNGAGKTTLMRALAGLVPATGRIEIRDRPLETYAARERARTLAYLPQGHVFHWPMPVADIVALGRQPHADPFTPPSEDDRAAVARALAATGVTEFAARPVTRLSGGERARVALARALATDASILLADEPTASLDPRHQLVVMELLRRIVRGGGTVLAIVHDLTLAARFADRILVMERGRIVADAGAQEALSARRMAETFGVEALLVETEDGRLPLPRRPL
jgi:iron complex transport system ATP-binding protein